MSTSLAAALDRHDPAPSPSAGGRVGNAAAEHDGAGLVVPEREQERVIGAEL